MTEASLPEVVGQQLCSSVVLPQRQEPLAPQCALRQTISRSAGELYIILSVHDRIGVLYFRYAVSFGVTRD